MTRNILCVVRCTDWLYGSFLNLCERRPDLIFDDYWAKNSKAELYHFIGKDIMYFHTLFWPALLNGADYRTPTAIFCHGFLTIDVQKMSKSRGTFIKANTYFSYLNPEYLRYYLAIKLNNRIEDLDINFDDFMQRINADLIGKFINIASRTASFINKYFSGNLSKKLAEPELFETFIEEGDAIADKFLDRQFSQAIRQIMSLADLANQYIDSKKPWSAIKDAANQHDVHEVCTMGINLFRILMIYLKPILPETAKKVEAFLNINPQSWADSKVPLLDHEILPFKPLAERLDKSQINALKEAAKLDVLQVTKV